jgi:hypothetical protein
MLKARFTVQASILGRGCSTEGTCGSGGSLTEIRIVTDNSSIGPKVTIISDASAPEMTCCNTPMFERATMHGKIEKL